MDIVDIFEATRLRDVWYDIHGLLKSARSAVVAGPARPRRNALFSARVAGLALALNVASVAYAAQEPAQMSLAWPSREASLSPQESLKEALQQMRELKDGWNGRGAPAPVERAISTAQFILGQLPDVVMDARAGVDGEGNVFLRLQQGERYAYLTVEPKAMHLLYMEPGQPNVYVDDEAHNGKIIPPSIRKLLDKRLKS